MTRDEALRSYTLNPAYAAFEEKHRDVHQQKLIEALWRRQGVGPWGSPYRSIPAGRNTYVFSDEDVTVGQTYQYMLAAQDCTPALSTTATTTVSVVAGCLRTSLS